MGQHSVDSHDQGRGAYVRLMTWNILHGGGGRRTPEIVLALLAHHPDILVLTEFRRDRGAAIRSVLADHALGHQLTTPQPEGKNGILLASRWPISPGDAGDPLPTPGRWLDAKTAGIHVTGVHIPDDSRPSDKARFWQHLVSLARVRAHARWAVLGDVNSGRPNLDEEGRTLGSAPLLGTFCTLGMVDAWRQLHPESREGSWNSHWGARFRIDAVYLSSELGRRLARASLSHAERENNVSDHSAVLVDLDTADLDVAAQAAGGQGHVDRDRQAGDLRHPRRTPGTRATPETPGLFEG
jgi:exonuclease III